MELIRRDVFTLGLTKVCNKSIIIRYIKIPKQLSINFSKYIIVITYVYDIFAILATSFYILRKRILGNS